MLAELLGPGTNHKNKKLKCQSEKEKMNEAFISR